MSNESGSTRTTPHGRAHGSWMERLSTRMAQWTGSTGAQVAAFGLILGWLVCGPVFHYSDTWQMTINTATTIVTFLMVFMIQRAQNKESATSALKLSEIVAALDGASNRLIDVGDLSEAEIRTLQEHFHRLVELSKQDGALTKSHSVEEAAARHERKQSSAE